MCLASVDHISGTAQTDGCIGIVYTSVLADGYTSLELKYCELCRRTFLRKFFILMVDVPVQDEYGNVMFEARPQRVGKTLCKLCVGNERAAVQAALDLDERMKSEQYEEQLKYRARGAVHDAPGKPRRTKYASWRDDVLKAFAVHGKMHCHDIGKILGCYGPDAVQTLRRIGIRLRVVGQVESPRWKPGKGGGRKYIALYALEEVGS